MRDLRENRDAQAFTYEAGRGGSAVRIIIYAYKPRIHWHFLHRCARGHRVASEDVPQEESDGHRTERGLGL